MNQKITAAHEQTDDIPAIITPLQKIHVAELLDYYFSTNWQEIS